MSQVLFMIFCLVSLTSPAWALAPGPLPYEERIREEGNTYIDCQVLEEEQAVCERLETARAIAARTSLKTFLYREGKGQKSYREFVLIAYDPMELRFHSILLGMPVEVGTDTKFQPLIRMANAEDYWVKRLRGQSLNKMVFKVEYRGRELFPYGAKHLLFTQEALHPYWGKKTVQKVTEVVYMATAPHLVRSELARHGQMLFMGAIDTALQELRYLRVKSRSHSDYLVADVVQAESVANLLLAEQTDPCLLEDRPRGCEKKIPERPYTTDEEVRQAVNVEFVVNGLKAFRYMRSAADARGVLQFTDNRKGKRLGTYSGIEFLYPTARLDPDFQRGSESLVNLAKAAALLIDYELSNQKVPDWARQAFLHNWKFALIIPGSAYNGGPSQAVRLAGLIRSFAEKQKLRVEEMHFDVFPWKEFEDYLDRPKSGLKEETRGYIKKIIHNWPHLQRHGPQVHIDKIEGELT